MDQLQPMTSLKLVREKFDNQTMIGLLVLEENKDKASITKEVNGMQVPTVFW